MLDPDEQRIDPLLPGQLLHRPRHLRLLRDRHPQIRRGPRFHLVERLARLYRELDYPDDARTAQHVASALVDAFRATPVVRA